MTGSTAGSQRSLITVGKGVTLTLKNITLVGLKNGQNEAKIDNNVSLITCTGDGKLILGDGAVITGNKTITGLPNGGGGITMKDNSILEMNGNSEVRGNSVSLNATGTGGGGGIILQGSSRLVMNGTSKVTDNSVSRGVAVTGGSLVGKSCGGGILLRDNSSLEMDGNSEVSNNTSDQYGGGIALSGVGIALSGDKTLVGSMGRDAKITGNSGATRGGGVYIAGGTFNMTGGTISGNKLSSGWGGGVFVEYFSVDKDNYGGTFNMAGGIVYGKDGGALSNTAYEGCAALFLEESPDEGEGRCSANLNGVSLLEEYLTKLIKTTGYGTDETIRVK